MMSSNLSKFIAPLIVLIVVLGLWHWSAERSLVPSYILPAPTIVMDRLLGTLPLMLSFSVITGIEILVGFGLAVLLGVVFAWLIAHVRLFEDAFYPWLVFVQVVPKVALGPLLVVWMGVGFLPKVLISFLLAFFPVMIDTLVGLKSVSRDYVFLLRSMGASPMKRFWRFQLPYALPHIFASLKVAVTLAAVGAIVGEFIGADKGLGYALIVATGTMDTALLFVALIWISGLSLVLYAAVGVLERIFVSWHAVARHNELRTAA
jgi:NitT/TauT family transport system permease protein